MIWLLVALVIILCLFCAFLVAIVLHQHRKLSVESNEINYDILELLHAGNRFGATLVNEVFGGDLEGRSEICFEGVNLDMKPLIRLLASDPLTFLLYFTIKSMNHKVIVAERDTNTLVQLYNSVENEVKLNALMNQPLMDFGLMVRFIRRIIEDAIRSRGVTYTITEEGKMVVDSPPVTIPVLHHKVITLAEDLSTLTDLQAISVYHYALRSLDVIGGVRHFLGVRIPLLKMHQLLEAFCIRLAGITAESLARKKHEFADPREYQNFLERSIPSEKEAWLHLEKSWKEELKTWEFQLRRLEEDLLSDESKGKKHSTLGIRIHQEPCWLFEETEVLKKLVHGALNDLGLEPLDYEQLQAWFQAYDADMQRVADQIISTLPGGGDS